VDAPVREAPIAVEKGAQHIAITPDGRTLYVTLFGVAEGQFGTVIPIRTATSKVLPPIRVGQLPTAIAITPAAR
jgi:DNA-binding beta-propeller fold protein YncE